MRATTPPAIAIGASFVSLVSASDALADPSEASAARVHARLEYERTSGAETCPEQKEIASTVAARLGYDPFDASASRRVNVRVRRRGKELEARVELRNEAGEVLGARDVSSNGTDCTELASTVALTISIALDPVSANRDSAPSPPEPPPSADASSASPSAVPEPPKPNDSERVRARAALGSVASLGIAPGPAVGFLLQIGARRGALALGLEGRADLPSEAKVDGDARVETSLLVGSVLPCVHGGWLFGCGVASFGSLSGTARDVANSARQRTLFIGAGVRIGGEIELERSWSLRLFAELIAPVTPTSLRIDSREVWSTSPVTGGLGAAVVGQIP